MLPVSHGFGGYLPVPVVDRTGLTNRYNFSLPYDTATRKELNDYTTATLEEMIGRLGLKFEPDTAPFKMLVVKKQS